MAFSLRDGKEPIRKPEDHLETARSRRAIPRGKTGMAGCLRKAADAPGQAGSRDEPRQGPGPRT
ncbi:hypothetical protein PSCLAVI8L_150075 [Pseudoclavibacter sp. 8L]|nr:hypothetical protein PSCLAVI8L_150075 [Pseudoclavibacter sp. 8L]